MASTGNASGSQEFENRMKTTDESIIVELLKKRADVIEALNDEKVINVEIKPKEKPFLKSKKFWGGMIALCIAIADQFTGADLWVVTLPVLVYIFGQGLADLGKNKSTT